MKLQALILLARTEQAVIRILTQNLDQNINVSFLLVFQGSSEDDWLKISPFLCERPVRISSPECMVSATFKIG